MQTRSRQFFLTDPIAYPSRGILHTPRCIPLPANYFELFHHTKDDHGVRRANTARALARWRRLGASHEATDTLHRAMCLAPYCPVGMVIAFVVDYVTFYYIVNNRVAIN